MRRWTKPPRPNRYDRDLISAADVTAWLDRVGLSADEWIDYLRRDLLRQQ
jgi:hypothetical protein